MLHPVAAQFDAGPPLRRVGARLRASRACSRPSRRGSSPPSWPRDLTVALVRQQTVAVGQASVLESLLAARAAAVNRPELEAERDRLEAVLDEGSEDPDAAAARLGEVYDLLDALEGPDAEREAKAVLHGLQFASTGAAASSLSGGWQRRLALAQALFVRADVLLLDEPTNHLDLAAVMWLADYLVAEGSTTVVVSHGSLLSLCVVTDVLAIEQQRLSTRRAGGRASPPASRRAGGATAVAAGRGAEQGGETRGERAQERQEGRGQEALDRGQDIRRPPPRKPRGPVGGEPG